MNGDMNNNNVKETTCKMWFRDCDCETTEPINGTRSGVIPSWLNGRLTRNGPGKYTYGDGSYTHLLDGSAYLHQFIISEGCVTYQSRFLQSDDHKKNSENNRIVVTQMGTVAHPDPCKTLLQRFMSIFEPVVTDNCSVNVVHMGDEFYAMTETPVIRRIDPNTLECIGEKTRVDSYVAVNTMSAHPHIEADGTIYNMGSSFTNASGPAYNIVKFPQTRTQTGRRKSSMELAEIVATIPCQWKMHPSYFHSFGMTDNYFVFVEMPLVVSIGKMFYNHITGNSYIGAVKWYPEEKTNFWIVDRRTGEMLNTRYSTEAFLAFHHTNVYEKDGLLVVDLTATSDGEVITKAMTNKDMRNVNLVLSTHRRFVLPLNVKEAPLDTNLVTLPGCKCKATKRKDGTIDIQGCNISDQNFELQRINYKYNGKEYTYSYGVGVNGSNEIDQLVKMNGKTGETQIWSETNKFVSEPVYVAAPDETREDQGVILSALLDKTDPRLVTLLVLDAESWKELGREEFRAKGTVTPTFHGQFAASGEKVHLY